MNEVQWPSELVELGKSYGLDDNALICWLLRAVFYTTIADQFKDGYDFKQSLADYAEKLKGMSRGELSQLLWEEERSKHFTQLRNKEAQEQVFSAMAVLLGLSFAGYSAGIVDYPFINKGGNDSLFGAGNNARSVTPARPSGAVIPTTTETPTGSGSRNTSNDFFSIGDIFKSLFGSNSSFGSSLIGLGSSLASSAFNFENQVKLIDKQNEYNTPVNQMARFAEAGLNPNLVYGMGSNGNQPSSGSPVPVDFDTSQREARLAKSQMKNQALLTSAELGSKQASINLMNSQAENQSQDTESKRLANSMYLQQTYAQLQNMYTDTQLKLANIQSQLQSVKESKARESLLTAQRETEDALRQLRANLTQAEINLNNFNAQSPVEKNAEGIAHILSEGVVMPNINSSFDSRENPISTRYFDNHQAPLKTLELDPNGRPTKEARKVRRAYRFLKFSSHFYN